MPSTWNLGKSLTANGTGERACYFCRGMMSELGYFSQNESELIKMIVHETLEIIRNVEGVATATKHSVSVSFDNFDALKE